MSQFKVGDKVTYTDEVIESYGLTREVMVVKWYGRDYEFFIDDLDNCNGEFIVVYDIEKKKYDTADSLRKLTKLEKAL